MSAGSQRRARARMDGMAAGRVRDAARSYPDSASARTGFARRAVGALYPVVPEWIMWLAESNQALAGWIYQPYYPPRDACGQMLPGWAAETFWTQERMFRAENEARKVVRARRFHGRSVAFAHAPALDDDEMFFAAVGTRTDFGGHWYSRDPAPGS
ncbi:hypothetical protein ACTWPB_07900 [Nocardia sp. IBHARD005]|uniref:hypothetical protein n=1 Tax=Nocardia sp. IBHARD005 TaxID=3457765 RepID=UPI0040597053